MRIRIRRPIAGIVDGISLSHLLPGLSYDVSDSLGGYLVSCGDAEPVPPSAPADLSSEDDRSDSPIFGGIVIDKPIDSAADRPAPKRRRRRRSS